MCALVHYEMVQSFSMRFAKNSGISSESFGAWCSPWQGPRYSGTMVETAGRGWLTREGFVSMWTFMAATDHLAAVEYLVYLGYEGSIAGILQLSKGRRQELTSRATAKAPARSFLKVPPGPLS